MSSGEGKGKSPADSSKEGMIRADRINLKELDMKLDKQLNKGWSKAAAETNRPKEEWEIDLASLKLRYIFARGTYGTIYRGTYGDKDVAVKVLDWGEDGMVTDAEAVLLRASFEQEVAVWHKLDHPNVTKFVGSSMGTSNLKLPFESSSSDAQILLPTKACCVVVEYLPGGTLKKFIISHIKKKLAFQTVIKLALDLARGLDYLNSKKIVHPDVKTENILLDSQKNIKIVDFGVARVEAQNPMDMTGETGTLGYMPLRFLMESPTSTNVMYTALESASGKYIVVTCLMFI